MGRWRADVRISPATWEAGRILDVDVSVHLDASLPAALARAGYQPEALAILLTSERCFDPDGWLRLPGDEFMSTLLTPSGLAIEGGATGAAISRSTGSRYRNPIDLLHQVPIGDLQRTESTLWASVPFRIKLPADIPPGIYRLRFDLGAFWEGDTVSLNGEMFADQPEYPKKNVSTFYSPTIPCSGSDASGRYVDATAIRRRVYWVLMGQYNSNGSYGAIADEDSGHFALSDRNIINDEVILPLGIYSLEPDFRVDSIDSQRNIPWHLPSGELSISVTDPSGRTEQLGITPFTSMKKGKPATGNRKFTAWKPSTYGRYTVVAKGWIADRWGNRYEGGGSYHFWIAERMTLATATFQGQPYPVGAQYGRDLAFAPAAPAEVTVKVDLYPNSDPAKVKTLTYSGRASPSGVFGAAQGMKPFVLDSPGEYHARVLATHVDKQNTLWVCSLRHAGVVYPTDSAIVARGKRLKLRNEDRFVSRGETHFEGFVTPSGDVERDHIPFPYNPGDLLLMASEGYGANKIESVLTWETREGENSYDPALEAHGATNLRILTSNGMSPHIYPEYITKMAYYYAAAPRPGYMCTFMVAEDGARFPYWAISDFDCGGQIGASSNGDLPGTIYRLLGGVVIRPEESAPSYAGYMASAITLPGGTNNNRVIAPGSEELLGPDGRKAHFFLVSLRPGMVYEQGTPFAPAFQIDPILPARIRCDLLRDGKLVKSWEGTGDANGSFVGSERVPLDRPGLYMYTVSAEWEGHRGIVPGLPDEGGQIYVIEREPEKREASSEQRVAMRGLKLNMNGQEYFEPEDGLLIEGLTTSDRVYYAAVTPGAVLEQGEIRPSAGRFTYHLDPVALSRKIPFYDIANRRTGEAEMGRVIHLTFFAREIGPGGSPYHAFARVIVRGNTAIYVA